MEYVENGLKWMSELGGSFRFMPGTTPLSEPLVPIATVLGYFVMIHSLQRWMEAKKPYELKSVLVVHNAFLCVASGMLFTWLLSVVVYKKLFLNHTVDYMICSEGMHDDGSLQLLYYLNHLTKYYELLDTILLVLRKKPVMFLHEYHHGATLLLTWSQQREHSTVQWVPILLNLGVHIAMYYYYAMAALKIRVWWKKYLTSLQILQFIIGVFACAYCYGKYIISGFDYSKCNGTDLGALTGIGILISYLILFVQFYIHTYKTKPSSKAKVN